MPVISQALRLKAFNPHCTQLFLQLPRCWIWHLYLLAHTLPSILGGCAAACRHCCLSLRAKVDGNVMEA